MYIPSENRNIPALQSLRGIAAIIVLLHHASFVFSTSPNIRFVSEILLNAHAAVVIFFVLSGYVLCRSLKWSDLSIQSVFHFYARRLFRIYPVVFFAVSLGLIYVTFLHFRLPTAHESAWFAARFPDTDIGPIDFLSNLFGLRSTLIPPMWSIRTELAASVLLPFIWLAWKKHYGWLIILATSIVCLSLSRGGISTYMFAFCLGAFLARYEDSLENIGKSYLLGSIGIATLLLFRLINSDWRFEVNYEAPIPRFVETVSSTVVILFVAKGTYALKWLSSKFLVVLGDISFSIYLLHFPIMATLSKLPIFTSMTADAASLILMGSTLLLTLPLSYVSYRLIEVPGIATGKAITKFFKLDPIKLQPPLP